MSNQALNWARAVRLHKTPKSVLMDLADRANGRLGHTCFPSQATIATDMGLSEKTVQICLAYLQEMGFISRSRRKRQDGSRTSDLIEVLVSDDEIDARPYGKWYAETVPATGSGKRGPNGRSSRDYPQALPDLPVGPTARIPKGGPEEGASLTQLATTSSTQENAYEDARERARERTSEAYALAIRDLEDDELWLAYNRSLEAVHDAIGPEDVAACEYAVDTLVQEMFEHVLG